MPGYFLDSSAVGKIYHAELGTAEVQRLVASAEARLYISRLSVIEVQSIFAKKVRTEEITTADAAMLRSRFLGDLRRRDLRVIAMAAVHYDEAERLIQLHGLAAGLRTLEALQLAVALDLSRRGIIRYFVAADKRLCEIAVAMGLTVFNPEAPQHA